MEKTFEHLLGLNAKSALAILAGYGITDVRVTLTGAPNIRFNNPEGAFYLFIDHRDTGLDSVTFCKRLLEEQLVACVPGDDFGPSGEGHIRISYATSTENCAEGARRIVDA